MKQGLLWLLLLVCLPGMAGERRVYLLATVALNGSNLAQSVFLHEPEITDLQGCEEAVKQGQRDRDWLKYHHILRRDKMQGYTAQARYRCVFAEQDIEGWSDRQHYDHTYLIGVDEQSRLSLSKQTNQALCAAHLRTLSAAQQAQSFCARSNQQVR